MRLVIDTNVLLNAILPTSSAYWLFDGIIEGRFTLCVTNEILSEYTEIFGRFYGAAVAESFLTALLYSPFVEKADTYYAWWLIEQDPDDNKFVDCAIAANAHYIITNDRHFRVLTDIPFPKVEVLNPEQLKTLLAT
jgi:putative PIN family toxin of toxin-antitoxin system